MSEKRVTTGAENVVWDLSIMYSGVDDPQIGKDLELIEKMAQGFRDSHKGNLSTQLGEALTDYSEITKLFNKLNMFLYLSQSTDIANAKIKAKVAQVQRRLSQISGEYLVFFEIEIGQLSDEVLEKQYKQGDVVSHHKPWLENIRKDVAPYLLAEEVENALAIRAPFGPSAWSTFYQELSSDLRFTFKDKEYSLEEILSLIVDSKNPADRADMLAIVNDGLGGMFAKYSAENLYMVAAGASVEGKQRGYEHAMRARNISNMVTDEVVETIHKAVIQVGTPLNLRYYRLKAAHLGFETLKWSDRNAPMPFKDTSTVLYPDAVQMVLAAYESFSPTLASLIKEMIDEKRIFAPAKKGARGGAFNYSLVLPGNIPVSYSFQNYQGTTSDVSTVAHELGHGVHGMLAGAAQGPLMAHAPIALCETASVFGEMTTDRFLQRRMLEAGDKQSLLAHLMGTIDRKINTLIRQIGFSNFEKRVHGMDATYTTWYEPQKLSVEELNAIWIQTVKELYGEDGDVFTYENIGHLWSYIPHFHHPFYVYGYAFGELLTSCLYAVFPSYGDDFEPLYLDALRSGGTRNVVELMKPFGLDPTREDFWIGGIQAGLGSLIEKAEELSAEMGVVVP